MWNGRETYFIYYACASDCIPYTFSIELNVSLLLINLIFSEEFLYSLINIF